MATTTNTKYILNSASGNLLDLRLKYGALSLDGQTATIVGGAGADYVYASAGTSVDFSGTNGSGAGDALYLDGAKDTFFLTKDGTTLTLTLTRGADTYKLNYTSTQKLVFTDGSILASDLANGTGALNPAETSLALPTATTSATENVSFSTAGVITSTAGMGKLIVNGSQGVDQVFIKSGAQADTTYLGGSTDIIWFTGKWSDYSKTVNGNTITFTRTFDLLNGDGTGTTQYNESVKVVGGTGILNDKLMFADGYIFSKDALANSAAANLSAAGGKISTKAGEFTDAAQLGDVHISGTVGISDDTGTGAGATDYVTSISGQTLNGSYTGTLQDGDRIRIKLNGGAWTDAIIDPVTKQFSLGGQTLTAGANTVEVELLSANGVSALAGREHAVTITNGGVITLDGTAPSGSLSFVVPADAFLNAAEQGTVDVPIKVTLDLTKSKVGDVVQLEITPNGGSKANTGTEHKITADDLKAGYFTALVPKADLTVDGIYTVDAKLTDAAQNSSTTNTVTITVDTSGPASTIKVSEYDGAGNALTNAINKDPYLNASESDIVFEITEDALKPWVEGDSIQIINPDTGVALGSVYPITSGDISRTAGTNKVRITLTKAQIAGAALTEGTYKLSVRTFDPAGNSTDSPLDNAAGQPLNAVVVDNTAISAKLTIASVGSDGSSAAGANQSTDKFLSATEDSVVIKIDSTVFNSKTALKVGDVITLQVETTPGTFSDLLKKSDGSAYTYKVTADDLADGNGAANAAYISVLKTDLTQGATNIIRANLVDAAGNQAYGQNKLSLTVEGDVLITMDTTAGDLQVTSPIVLTSSQSLSTAAHFKITFTNTGNANAFAGENKVNTFSVYADDTRYVSLSADGKKIIINPSWDFDFGNSYEVTVEAGAFKTAADTANGIPALSSKAVDAGGGLNFSTTDLSGAVGIGSAVQGYVMDTATGLKTTTGAKKWFAVPPGSTDTFDFSGADYAIVFKDLNEEGHNTNINDGVAASEFNVTVNEFGAGDLIYADDQNNNFSKLNNSQNTQLIDNSDGSLYLHFDPDTSDIRSGGGTFTVNTVAGSGITASNLLNQLNIANTKSVATPITAIERVDSTGAPVASNLLGKSITNSQPLLVKLSAGIKAGDQVQLVYIDGAGAVQNLGSTYTATTADASRGYVTLSVSRTDLGTLPAQEGFNKIFAQLTNDTTAVSFSDLLGGSDGVFLDAVAPTPTLLIKTGQDATITSAESGVDLVVKATDLKVGDTLKLLKSDGSTLATVTIDATNVTQDVVFNVTKASGNLAFGNNVFTLVSTDNAGNAGSTSITIARSEYVTYNGTVGLGPVVGTDLQVTAYNKDGTVLGTAGVEANGTFTLNMDKTYLGAVTLRVTSKTSAVDYRDESTNTDKDLGAGSIATVLVADGTSQTVHITAVTDLVARQLTSAGNTVAADANQIKAYNLELSKLLGLSSTLDVSNILPTFVLNATGTATLSVAGKYGQLLAQISDQAAVHATTVEDIQSQLANAITWTWDSVTKTATAQATGDMAKQVILLTKVAQAEALTAGADASSFLTAADLVTYGITGVADLTTPRKTDLIARIVSAADEGSAYDTIAELQALANKEVVLAKIQDYANSSANPAPTLDDYTAAGMTGVTASNLTAVNSKMVNSAAGGTVPSDGLIQTVVTLGVAAQATAIAKIADYANDTGTTKPAPTIANYAIAGITGVTTDNLAAINAKVYAITNGTLTAASLASDIQPFVDTAVTAYSNALATIRAYIRDAVANTAPDDTTFADAGLASIDSPNEITTAKFYLSTIMNVASADGTDASILSSLAAQQAAINKISAYAASSANPTPTVADYVAAGITGATSTNLSQLNTSVDGESAIANAVALSNLFVPIFAGIPSLTSIDRAGTSVVNGAFTNDAYLNAAELASGKTSKFTVTFDRGVTGLTATNFGLTDASGNAITGATPTITINSADAGAGKLWTVTVGGLNGLTSSSLRLNLVNNTDIKDTLSTKALSNSSFTGGQSYTVDTTNPITLAAASGEDLTLSNTENSVNLYVDPANLSVGDTLKLTKADGTQVGSAVTVNAGHLSTGVTFNVAKSSLSNGANALTLISTDIAGNTGSATATVTVGEYVQVTGILGLPSKVLAGNDLKVTAYDASNNVLGTGTIDATTNTYTLQLLKSATGLVKLQLSSSGNAKDYWDEANAAQADLGSMAITATISADGTAKTANITLLSDVASRLIAGITTPTAAQISAANLAVTKLLVNNSSSTGVTAVVPDFAVTNTGSSSTSTATVYGQLLNQLSQQAQSKGRALDVVLEDLAAGISYTAGASTATLNNAFAKEVFLLAKVQMAAALATGTIVSASVLKAQDLIDGGVTGISGLNDTRKADLLARIVATSDDGNAVDTLAELQALADKVVAIAKIQEYAISIANPAPGVADYVAAGYSTVTADNLTAINQRIDASDATGTATDALISTIVTNGVSNYNTAIAKIAAYANLNTNPAPTVADYVAAGVTGVTAANLVAVNAKVDAQVQANADSTSEVQTLANAGAVAYSDAMSTIKNYIAKGIASDVPTATTFRDAGLPAIDTVADVENANYYLDNIFADADSTLTDAVILSKLSAQQVAIDKIDAYAADNTKPAPTVADYQAAGITAASSASLGSLNSIVDGFAGGTASTNTIAGLKTAVSSVFELQPSVLSITTAGSSVVNGAFQSDAIINSAELAGTIQFTVTFDRAVNGLSASNFSLVDALGVAVAGATPTYTISTIDNITYSVSVGGLSGMTSTTARLDMVNKTGIVDVTSGQAPKTGSFTGASYAVDTAYNTTISAASGEDLTLTPDETAANIFVGASKLTVGDTLTLKLGSGAILATKTVSAGDISAGGVTLTALKSALVSPAPGAASDTSNAIVLTHTDTSGNVGVANGTLVVARTVTVSGTVGLGPVVSTDDLLVTAYDAAGKVLSTSAVNGSTGAYSLSIARTYTGPLLLRVSNTGSGADYRDEATGLNLDLGSATISSVITADGSNKTAHITPLTDIAARLLTVSDGMVASDTTSAKVDAANLLVAKNFIDSTTTQSVTAITPNFTITSTGAVDVTATRYGQILASLSKQMADSGAGLAYTQATVVNSITFNYNSSTPASSTMTLGQAATDTVFLAKVGQAASLSNTTAVSTVLTAADLTAYGITGFSSLSAARQTDVITRIVNGADSGAGTNTVAKVQALVDRVQAIGVIQDFKTSGGTAPTADVYATAGFTGVTAANVGAVNNVVTATLADITANPDTVIAAAITSGAGTQSTAFAVITAYAQNGTTAPTVQNYADAGLTGVTSANLAAVNSRIDAKVATDINTVALAQTVVDAGAVAYTDAVLAIKNYVADSTLTAAPTLTQYKDANLASITTATQVDNANYLLSKVINGTNPSTATLATALADQITAINTINAYAVNNTATVPVLNDYLKAGFLQVTASNLTEINTRVNAAATMSSTASILSLLKAIDLDGSTAAVQASTSALLGTPTLSAGTLLFANVNKTYTDDISSITIAASGSIDASYDKFSFSTIAKLINNTAQTGSGITLNGVSGLDWAYNSAKKLIFTKTDGSSFTAAEAQLVEKAVKFTSAPSSSAGDKVFTLSHTDAAGTSSVSGAMTISADTSVQAVDLSASTANVQATLSGYVNATTALTGKALVPAAIGTPTDTDIAKISIVVGGSAFDPTMAKLKLDIDQPLSSDFAASNVTIAGLSGISYSYTASTKTLLLFNNSGAAFTPANIPTLVSGIVYKTASTTTGDRTFDISYIDLANNQGTSGRVTLTADMSIGAPQIRLNVDDGSNASDGITSDGTVSVSGIASGDAWSYSLDGGTTWTAGSGSSIASSAFGAAGSKTVQVKSTDAAGNSATSSLSFTLVAPITKTTTLSAVRDDASINGSTGSAGTPVTITAGGATDDTTPTISGTISATLGANEVVAIYDGLTRLGTATVTTTSWTYTPTALATGLHSFTARIENTSTGAQGPASSAYAANIQGSLNMKITDDVGTVSGAMVAAPSRYIAFAHDVGDGGANWITDIAEIQIFVDNNPTPISLSTLTGTNMFSMVGGTSVSAAMDGSTATSYTTPNSAAFKWGVIDLGANYNVTGVRAIASSSAANASNANAIAFYTSSTNPYISGTFSYASTAAMDAAPSLFRVGKTPGTGITVSQTMDLIGSLPTDDATPTFSGTLTSPLVSGEELALYQTLGGTTTKMGVATIAADGVTWTYTPSALANGAYTFKAMVQAAGDSTGTAGKVVSVSNAITIASTLPTQTVTITTAKDNYSIKSSAGTVASPATIDSGDSTDDNTPDLSGTLSAALGTNQVLAIYDGTTKLGNATVTGTTWSYTSSTLAVGSHSLTARVENTTTGAQGLASSAYVVKVNPTITIGVAEGATPIVSTTPSVINTTTFSATTAAAVNFGKGNLSDFTSASNFVVSANTTTVGGGTSTFTPSVWGFDNTTQPGEITFWIEALCTWGAVYAHQIKLVNDASGNILGTVVQAGYFMGSAGVANPTAVSGWTSTGGNPVAPNTITLTNPNEKNVGTAPSLSGTLSAAMGAGEELAIYDGATKLGVATLSADGLSWSYSTSGLSAGVHALRAVVQPAGTSNNTNNHTLSDILAVKVSPLATVSGLTVKDDASINGSIGSTAAVVANGTSTDDTTPIVSGTLSATLGTNEVVAVYDGATKVGNATVSGTTWTYTTSALGTGTHSFTARVENTSTGAKGVYSTASSANVVATTPAFSFIDDVGAVQKSGLARYIMLRRDASVGTYKQFDIGEVTVMANGTNVALNKSFTTGAQGTLLSENKLTDGTTSSWYASTNANVSNAWVQIDLGAEYLIDSISVAPRTGLLNAEGGIVNTNVYYSRTSMSAGASTTTAAQAPDSNAVLYGTTSGVASTATQILAMSAPSYSDDSTPIFKGALSMAMAAGEELALYQTIGGTTTKMGVATIQADGLTWTFTPSSPLVDGAYTFKAMVQPAGDTLGLNGRVVSASAAVTIDTSTPAQTVVIGSVQDNVSINGSTGSVATPVNVANGEFTDDTTPTLSGTLSAALGAMQAVVVYDGATKLGNATVTGTNWSFTPSTALGVGAHSLTARVENVNTGVQGAASSAYVAKVGIFSPFNATDDVGLVQNTAQIVNPMARYIMVRRELAVSQQWTLSELEVMSGGTNVALGKTVTLGSQGEALGTPVTRLVDGSTSAISGTYSSTFVFSPTSAWIQIDLGALYSIDSIVVTPSTAAFGRAVDSFVYYSALDMSTGIGATTASQAPNATSALYGKTPSSISSFTPITLASPVPNVFNSDDATPTFSGVLDAPLHSGEELALYKTVGGTTTKMGVASLNADGLTWSYTADPLADGTYTFKAMIQPVGNTSGTSGKVVSPNSSSMVIDTSTPTQTVTISNVTDNSSINGSTGSAGTPVSVATGTATDDTTPTLNGTISAALTGSQVVAIYDGATKLGNATVTGTTWSFTPGTALSSGARSFTAYVETLAGKQGPASAAYVADVYSNLALAISDDVGTRQGALAGGAYTDDNHLTLSGSLLAALDATEELAIYQTLSGTTTKIGVATVSGLNWSFTPTAAMSDGAYTFSAMVQPLGNATGTAGKVVSATTGTINIDTSSPTQTTTLGSVTDNVSSNGSMGSVGTPLSLTQGMSTDDTTPTLSGTISGALSGAQVVAVYDGSTKLGNATVTGTSWSFTTAALADGVHSFSARVENGNTGAFGTKSQNIDVNLNSNFAMKVMDNAGALQGSLTTGAYSDDTTPTFSGTLPVALGSGEELAIYQTFANGVTVKLGAATVTGSDWSYTPAALNAGTYSFKAIVQPVGDSTGAAGRLVSASSSVMIGSTDTTFNAITNTDPTSGLAVKALSVVSGMTLDLQTNSHTEIDVLNLAAGATAKIDLGDVMQTTAGLFQSPTFAGLTGASALKQLVVSGAAGSSVVVDSAALAATWIKSATAVTNSGHTYDVYNNTNGQAQLLIDQLVSRSGAVI